MNNGEVIAAILAVGVFNKVSKQSNTTLPNSQTAVVEAVSIYNNVLNELKQRNGDIFLPDHSKRQSNDALGELE